MPVVPPPVPHPALGALLGGSRAPSPSVGCGAPVGPATPPPPETTGVQVTGKELKQAVAAVTALEWFDDLAAAKARSAAAGKPILLLQALGDLEGFA